MPRSGGWIPQEGSGKIANTSRGKESSCNQNLICDKMTNSYSSGGICGGDRECVGVHSLGIIILHVSHGSGEIKLEINFSFLFFSGEEKIELRNGVVAVLKGTIKTCFTKPLMVCELYKSLNKCYYPFLDRQVPDTFLSLFYFFCPACKPEKSFLIGRLCG